MSFKLCLNCFRGIIGTHSSFYARMVEAVAFDEEAQRRIEAREEETHRALSRAQAMLSGAQKRHADAAEAPELRRTVEALLAQVDRKDDELDALKARLNAVVANIEHHPDDLREIDRLLAVEAAIRARIAEFQARAQEDKLNRAYALAARQHVDDDCAALQRHADKIQKQFERLHECENSLTAKVSALESDNDALRR